MFFNRKEIIEYFFLRKSSYSREESFKKKLYRFLCLIPLIFLRTHCKSVVGFKH